MVRLLSRAQAVFVLEGKADVVKLKLGSTPLEVWTSNLGETILPLVQTKAPLTETALPPAVKVPLTRMGLVTSTGYGGKMAAESVEFRTPDLIRILTSTTTVALSRPGNRLLATSWLAVNPCLLARYTRSFLTESALIPTGNGLPA